MENWKYPGMELINQKVDPTPSWINPSETFHSKSNRPPPFISRKAVSGEWSYVRTRTDLLRTIHDGYVRSCVYTRWLIHAISGASPHPRAIFKSRVFFSAAKPLAGVKRADNCLRRQSSARVSWGERGGRKFADGWFTIGSRVLYHLERRPKGKIGSLVRREASIYRWILIRPDGELLESLKKGHVDTVFLEWAGARARVPSQRFILFSPWVKRCIHLRVERMHVRIAK